MSLKILSLAARAFLLSSLFCSIGIISRGQTRSGTTRSTSAPTRASQPSTTSGSTGIKQRTIQTYAAFYSMKLPNGQPYWKDLVFRQNAIRRLNLQNADPDLATFFHVLDRLITEGLPLFKDVDRVESEYQQAIAPEEDKQERWRIAHGSTELPPDDSYLQSLRWDFRNYKTRTEASIDRLGAKYAPLYEPPLKRLTAKYQYQFYSSSFEPLPAGKEAPTIGNAIASTVGQTLVDADIGFVYVDKSKAPKTAPRASGGSRTGTNTRVSKPAPPASTAASPRVARPVSAKPVPAAKAKKATELYHLGQSYNDQDKYQEAVETLKSALQLNPNYADARYALGFSYQKLGRCPLAIDEYKEAVRLAPENQGAQYGLGWCYGDLKRYGDAIDPLRQAVQLNPNLTDAHVELGYALAQTQQYDEAIAQYQIAIGQKPDYGLSHYYLGRAYLASGNRNAALEQYRILKKLDTENARKLNDEINNRKTEKNATKTNQNGTTPDSRKPEDSKAKKALRGIWDQIKIKKPN